MATVRVGDQVVVFRTSRGTYIRTESGEILDASDSHFAQFHSANFNRKYKHKICLKFLIYSKIYTY